MDAFRCHVTETWIIDLALNSIKTWARDATERSRPDLGAHDILRRRMDDLSAIRLHLDQLSRTQLLSRLDNTVSELKDRLRDIATSANRNLGVVGSRDN